MPKDPEDDATILRRYGIEPDPVIEAYKKDVDRTLLRENLKLTPDQRLEKLQSFVSLTTALGEAARRRS